MGSPQPHNSPKVLIKEPKYISQDKKDIIDKIKDIGTRKVKISGGVAGEKLKKALSKNLTNKRIIKKSPQATVVLNQPVYSKDRSRFFKEAWEEEKRSLFFK